MAPYRYPYRRVDGDIRSMLVLFSKTIQEYEWNVQKRPSHWALLLYLNLKTIESMELGIRCRDVTVNVVF